MKKGTIYLKKYKFSCSASTNASTMRIFTCMPTELLYHGKRQFPSEAMEAKFANFDF